MFRGREMTHPERGRALLIKLAEEVTDLGIIESNPLQDGRNMVMMLAPHKNPVKDEPVADEPAAPAAEAAVPAAEAEPAAEAPSPQQSPSPRLKPRPEPAAEPEPAAAAEPAEQTQE